MKIYITEDEPLAAAKLKLFLEKLGEGPDIRLFENGLDLTLALSNVLLPGQEDQAPDVIFLDIEMPGMNGIEVLQRLQERDIKPQIVITSAYEKYALTSFNFSVTDYLLKPYDLDRLRMALARVKEAIRLRRLDAENQKNTSFISVRSDGLTKKIDVSQITMLQSVREYVSIHLTDGTRILALGTTSSFESQLPSDVFKRVHRSYIINIKQVKSYNSREIILSDDNKVSVGKTYREQIDELF